MKKARPDLLTVIVPRHPERGPFIARLLEGANLKVALRSEGKLPEAGTDIYIADTIGELGLFYNLVPVALIGGSLVPHGGQNPVEAIKLGAAVVTGPHWRNFAEVPNAVVGRAGSARCREMLSREVVRPDLWEAPSGRVCTLDSVMWIASHAGGVSCRVRMRSSGRTETSRVGFTPRAHVQNARDSGSPASA